MIRLACIVLVGASPFLPWPLLAHMPDVEPARSVSESTAPGIPGFARRYIDLDYGGNGKPGWVRAGDMDLDGDVDIVTCDLFFGEEGGETLAGPWASAPASNPLTSTQTAASTLSPMAMPRTISICGARPVSQDSSSMGSKLGAHPVGAARILETMGHGQHRGPPLLDLGFLGPSKEGPATKFQPLLDP